MAKPGDPSPWLEQQGKEPLRSYLTNALYQNNMVNQQLEARKSVQDLNNCPLSTSAHYRLIVITEEVDHGFSAG